MNEHSSSAASHDLRSAVGRWSIVVLLAAIGGGLLTELVRGAPAAQAQAQAVGAGTSGRFLAVAGQVTGDTYGLYLVDLETGIITVYQWVPGRRNTGILKLLAARNTTYDRQMDEYNTEPSPKEIQKLVGRGRGIGSPAP